MRTILKDAYLKGGHDKDFRPAKMVHEKMHVATYEYKPLGVDKKKNFRDAEGAVIVGPISFITNPIKQGKVGKGTTLGGIIPYVEDEYDIKKKIAL